MYFRNWTKKLGEVPPPNVWAAPQVSPPETILAQGDDGAAEQLAINDYTARAAYVGKYEKAVELDHMDVMIDYCDAQGMATRRPITIQSVESGQVFPTVTALCHAREAIRTFRFDRISNIITLDGEVLEPYLYFRDYLGIDMRLFARLGTDAPDDPVLQAREVRAVLRPAISILVMAARADGHFHREELDVILIYVEKELFEMEKLGKLVAPITIPMLDRLATVIRNLRPDANAVSHYLDRIEAMNESSLKRFWQSFQSVMYADGKVTDDESDFMEWIEGLKRR